MNDIIMSTLKDAKAYSTHRRFKYKKIKYTNYKPL